MNFDKESQFSDAQAVTTGTIVSTNVIDFGAVDTPKHAVGPITRDVGRGNAMPMRVQVVEVFNNLTSLTFTLQTSDAEGFGSGVTDVVQHVVPLADLITGYVLPLQYMPNGVDKRYVRMTYEVTGTAATTGKITAGLVFGQQNWSA